MQMVHCCYDLQGCLSQKERKLVWTIANESPPPNKISAAVLTQWWYVNMASQHCKENWSEWKRYKTCLFSWTMASTKVEKLASSLLSLMEETQIYTDLLFICAFSKSFFVKHFKWLQGSDSNADNFGFRSHDMAVHSFVVIGKTWRSFTVPESDI